MRFGRVLYLVEGGQPVVARTGARRGVCGTGAEPSHQVVVVVILIVLVVVVPEQLFRPEREARQ